MGYKCSPKYLEFMNFCSLVF